MVLIFSARLVFRFFKVRQYAGEIPSAIAELCPAVIVLVLAPNIEQPVDGTRSAEYFATGPLKAAVVDTRVRICLVAPVELRVVHGFEVADRYVNPRIAVRVASFQKQDFIGGIFRQPIGQNTTCRACTDHNKVKSRFGTRLHGPPRPE